ncbi:hypothetical protein ACFLVF_03685, partial [Chloroflexota bacterium]
MLTYSARRLKRWSHRTKAVTLTFLILSLLLMSFSPVVYAAPDSAKPAKGDVKSSPLFTLTLQKSIVAFQKQAKLIEITGLQDNPSPAIRISPQVSYPMDSFPQLAPTMIPGDPECFPTVIPGDPNCLPTVNPTDPNCFPTLNPSGQLCYPTMIPTDPNCFPTMIPTDPN